MDDCIPLAAAPPWEEIPGGMEALFDLPRPPARYEVKVTLKREADECAPDEGQAVAELAVAALCADDLLTAWSSEQSVFTMVLMAGSDAEALAAGVAMVKAIGGTRGATVSAERAG